MVRHGSFKGLREDKPAAAVGLELPEPAQARAGPLVVPRGGARKRTKVTVEGRELGLSNLDKVLYPASRLHQGRADRRTTRGSPTVLLPHLRGRPLTLKRYPDGVEGKLISTRSAAPSTGPTGCGPRGSGASSTEERDRLLPGRGPADAGLGGEPGRPRAAHLALAARPTIERPTAVVFDLDPGAAGGRPRLRPGRALDPRLFDAARPRAATRRPPARRACRCTCR